MVQQIFNQAALHRLLETVDGPTGREMFRRGLRVQSRARQLVRVDRGRLRSSITVSVIEQRGGVAVRIGTSVPYGRWVHDGTGIYGPAGRMITPTNAAVMTFTPRTGGDMVYTMTSRGQHPNPFLAEALKFGMA